MSECSYLMRSSGWYLYQTPHQAQHSYSRCRWFSAPCVLMEFLLWYFPCYSRDTHTHAQKHNLWNYMYVCIGVISVHGIHEHILDKKQLSLKNRWQNWFNWWLYGDQPNYLMKRESCLIWIIAQKTIKPWKEKQRIMKEEQWMPVSVSQAV